VELSMSVQMPAPLSHWRP